MENYSWYNDRLPGSPILHKGYTVSGRQSASSGWHIPPGIAVTDHQVAKPVVIRDEITVRAHGSLGERVGSSGLQHLGFQLLFKGRLPAASGLRKPRFRIHGIPLQVPVGQEPGHGTHRLFPGNIIEPAGNPLVQLIDLHGMPSFMKRQLGKPILVISVGVGIGEDLEPFGRPDENTVGKTGFVVDYHGHITVPVSQRFSQSRIEIFKPVDKGLCNTVNPVRIDDPEMG